MLRALGAGPAATAADGLPGILAATAAGSLLAAAVAVALSPLTLFGPMRGIEPLSGIYLDWAVLGLGALGLAMLLGAVACVIGLRQAPHRAATRNAAGRVPGAVRAGLAAGLPVPAIAGLRFALEPGRGRTAVPVRSVIAASVLAVFVVIATLTFGASLSTLISHPALYGWNFSYALYSTDGYGAFSARFIDPQLRADRMVAASHRGLLRDGPGRRPDGPGHHRPGRCRGGPAGAARPRARWPGPDRARPGNAGPAAPEDR